MTVPLRSSFGVLDEDNAREESRKNSGAYGQCHHSHLLSVHLGMFCEDDAHDGNQKVEKLCVRLEKVHGPEFGLSLRSFLLCVST